MDGDRFDSLARALGTGRSRRGVLKGLGAAALGAVGLGRIGPAGAARICRPPGQLCRVDGDCCSTRCLPDTARRRLCGAPVVCTASDQCHLAGTYDPRVGACTNPVAPGTTSCDDGDLCTTGDLCQTDGTCVGTPVDCPPATNECFTAGTCQSDTGLCSGEIDRGEGAACSTGVCHSQACCTPDDAAACAGRCGAQTKNNCNQSIGCAPCACGAVVGVCPAGCLCSISLVAESTFVCYAFPFSGSLLNSGQTSQCPAGEACSGSKCRTRCPASS